VTRARWPRTAGLVLLAALTAAGCTGAPAAQPPAPATGTASVYVAIGASESVGVGSDDPLRGAWTHRLWREAFPRGAVLVNMGWPGATVEQALWDQLPLALEQKPDVVTVWLNVNDLVARVPVDEYRRDLRTLVVALRRDGATQVLVANTPPLDQLPAYRGCVAGDPEAQAWAHRCPHGAMPPPDVVNAAVAAYNEAIAEVVRESGATLVDLHAATMAARQAGTEPGLVGEDGFHPSDAGHELVARQFAAALSGEPKAVVADRR
jgi:lysophospholipase L1-like esterase